MSRSYVLSAGTYDYVILYGKKHFAGVMKTLEMGDYLGLSGWVLNTIICVLVGGRQRDI